jgi:excisionase family DNA binding protein
MAVPRRHRPRTHEASADQLTLADWEREQALDPNLAIDRAPQAATSRPSDRSDAAPVSPSQVDGDRPVAHPTGSTAREGFGARLLLTVAEVADVTGLSTNAVYRAIASGELRASKLRGRLRVQRSAVDAWVDAARVPAHLTARDRRGSATIPRARTQAGRGLRELLQTATATPR